MKQPLIFLLAMGLVVTSCINQSPHSDLKERALKGPVRMLRDTYFIMDPAYKVKPDPIITEYYFNRQGTLERVEKWNSKVNGKQEKNYFSTYVISQGRPESYRAVDRRRKVVETGEFSWTDARHYVLKTFAVEGVKSEIDITLDENGRLQKKVSKINFFGTGQRNTTVMIYYDDSGNIDHTIVGDLTGTEQITNKFVGLNKDKYGNPGTIYFIKEATGDTIGKSEHYLEYY